MTSLAHSPILPRLLPGTVAAAEAFDEDLAGELPPLWRGEEGAIGLNAVLSRRASYHWSRALARRAMSALGHDPSPVPVGPAREPRWPASLVGSITHCEGYCAAAVGRRSEWAAVGIDAELVQPMSDGVVGRIASDSERAFLASQPDPVRATVALFSAKEAAYKVWYPVTGTWLGFLDAKVEFGEPEAGTVGRFVAHVLVPVPATAGASAVALAKLEGCFIYERAMVLTAIAVPADCRPPATWDHLISGFASYMGLPSSPIIGPP